MQITKATLEDFTRAVEKVSPRYDGNLVMHPDSHATGATSGAVARVGVVSSRCSGARRSWTGRRVKAACWHAYRDVLSAFFDDHPYARVKTSMANYNGKEGFVENYPNTAYQNVGSQMMPAYMPELCDCGYDA